MPFMNTQISNLAAEQRILRRLRVVLAAFIIGLVLSGLTAFPLEWELNLLARWLGIAEGSVPGDYSGLRFWIATVRDGLRETYARYPFMAYGTDWLAFAHLVIATAFIGPWRDPVKNVWIFEWAMIACVGILPLALICGPLRDIPFYWRLIDCSFGVVGMVPLWLCRRDALALERLRNIEYRTRNVE